MTDFRSESELKKEFIEQIFALNHSCENFDKGNIWEAKRIATIIFLLLHDGDSKSKSKSLLGQMGLKNSVRYISSSRGLSDTFWPKSPLCVLGQKLGAMGFEPICWHENPNVYRITGFNTWWAEDVIQNTYKIGPAIDNRNLEKKYSRKNLMYLLRSREGGAHYDSSVRDEEYKNLSIDVGIEVTDDGGVTFRTPENVVSATVRQIGWELLQSLKGII